MTDIKKPLLITILGPTASGKTRLAVQLAARLNGEIISADSRQVYRGMDLGTGKDLAEYRVPGGDILVHGIDVVDPQDEYNVFRFQSLFLEVFPQIVDRGKYPILCGGTGFYLSSILDQKRLVEVPEDLGFRHEALSRTSEELACELKRYKPLHNETDLDPRERLVRALEIARFESACEPEPFVSFRSLIFGLEWDPIVLRERILYRINQRIEQGMIEEVSRLRVAGISDERLDRFGLEYRYILKYLKGELSLEEMVATLHWAICDFAKRQRTWFRKMERQGHEIFWIPGEWELDRQVNGCCKNLVDV